MSHLVSIFKLLLVLVPIAVAFYFLLKQRDAKQEAKIDVLIAGQRVTDSNMKRVFAWLEHLVGCKEAQGQQLASAAGQLAGAVDDLRLADANLTTAVATAKASLPAPSQKANRRTLRQPKATELAPEAKFKFQSFPPLPPPLNMPLVPVPMPKFDDLSSEPAVQPTQAIAKKPIVTKRRALILGAVLLIGCCIGGTSYLLINLFGSKSTESLEAKAAKVAQVQAAPASSCSSACTPNTAVRTVSEDEKQVSWAEGCLGPALCAGCHAVDCTTGSREIVPTNCRCEGP